MHEHLQFRISGFAFQFLDVAHRFRELFGVFFELTIGKFTESQAEIKELYKEHPDFGRPYVEHILKGVNPQMQQMFMDNLQKLFSVSNP